METKTLQSQLLEIIQVSENSDKKKYYEDVELTDKEIIDLLNEAKQKKFHLIEREQKKREYEEQIENLKKPFTPQELQRFVLQRTKNEIITDRELMFNDEAKAIFKALCYYFSNDAEFETMGENWKLSKGICLMGNVGTGKTTLMRMFSKNKRQCFSVIKCRDVASEFADNGHDTLKIYSTFVKNYTNDQRYFLQPELGYCFDDLGTEGVKKNFGNQVNVMEEILLNRYDNNIGWHFTHLTTNLTADQIGDIYGTRVRSRMREMFNIIELTGTDLRK